MRIKELDFHELKKILSELQTLIKIKSFDDATNISNYVESKCVKLCKNVEVYDGHVVVILGDRGPSLGLIGHLDTVWPSSSWDTPFQPKIVNGRVYGLGSSDMKSGIAVMLYLLKKFSKKKLKGKLLFIFSACEESSTRGKEGIKTLLDKGLEIDKAIVLEPAFFNNRPNIVVGCQGILQFIVKVNGKSVHSSIFEKGINPIYRVIPLIESIKEIANNLKIIKLGNLTSKPSLSVTKIESGLSSNVIPDECKIIIDRRLSPLEKEEVVIDEMSSLFKKKLKTNFTWDIVDTRPAGYILPNHALVRRLRDELVSLGHIPIIKLTRGWVDIALLIKKGIPSISFGPGDILKAHSINESVNIKNISITTTALINSLSHFGIV
jgi:acetylornithine deacetylase/succinyl-diaminopimelate desuccinylase-like protein